MCDWNCSKCKQQSNCDRIFAWCENCNIPIDPYNDVYIKTEDNLYYHLKCR
jgi:hypothetical protein